MKNLFWFWACVAILITTVVISFIISERNLAGIIVNDVFAIGSGVGIVYFYNKIV